MYVLDTNVIIYYIKDDPIVHKELNEILSKPISIFISSITEIELFSFKGLGSRESSQIETILQTLISVPLDSRIARIAAEIRRIYSLKIPDSAIAATAFYTNTTLVTRNIRDFKKIPGLNLLKI